MLADSENWHNRPLLCQAYAAERHVNRFRMHNEFTAIIERDGKWFIAYCPEIPGANGQGETLEECRESLAQAIALILEDRREDALKGTPPNALRETLIIG